MKITQINPNTGKLIVSQLNQAFRKIEEDFGIKISHGNWRYDDKSLSLKIQANILEIFDPNQLLIGNKFKDKSTIFTVEKIDQIKQRIEAITNRGKKYYVRFDQLANYIKLEGYPIDYQQLMKRFENVDYNQLKIVEAKSENIDDFEQMMEEFNIPEEGSGKSYDRSEQIKQKLQSNDIGSLVYTNPSQPLPVIPLEKTKKQYKITPKIRQEDIEVI